MPESVYTEGQEERMTTIWLGCYMGYPWSRAFSTEKKARAWLLAGDSCTRQTASMVLDADEPQR